MEKFMCKKKTDPLWATALRHAPKHIMQTTAGETHVEGCTILWDPHMYKAMEDNHDKAH